MLPGLHRPGYCHRDSRVSSEAFPVSPEHSSLPLLTSLYSTLPKKDASATAGPSSLSCFINLLCFYKARGESELLFRKSSAEMACSRAWVALAIWPGRGRAEASLERACPGRPLTARKGSRCFVERPRWSVEVAALGESRTVAEMCLSRRQKLPRPSPFVTSVLRVSPERRPGDDHSHSQPILDMFCLWNHPLNSSW